MWALALLLIYSVQAEAKLITYRDEKGVLHAVQNEEEIPAKFRKASKVLGGVEPINPYKDCEIKEGASKRAEIQAKFAGCKMEKVCVANVENELKELDIKVKRDCAK